MIERRSTSETGERIAFGALGFSVASLVAYLTLIVTFALYSQAVKDKLGPSSLYDIRLQNLVKVSLAATIMLGAVATFLLLASLAWAQRMVMTNFWTALCLIPYVLFLIELLAPTFFPARP